jgi:hypothetical protein
MERDGRKTTELKEVQRGEPVKEDEGNDYQEHAEHHI